MLARLCHRLCLSAARVFTAACLAGVLWPASAVEAVDAYFPATIAYHRRNYDPFDQPAAEAAPESSAESKTPESGDVQLTSEIRQLGSDSFDNLSPPPTVQVTPAAFQAVAPRAHEPLPSPPSASTQADGPNEPGTDWIPKPLCELTTNTVLPGGVLPRDYWSERSPQHLAFFDPSGATRGWPVNSFNWVANCLCHNPLYFEEINLERYGYGCCACLQPAVSAAHFFGTVPALPYKMAVDCPGECDYTLGHYRPGSCPPWQYHCCTRCSALGGLSAGGAAVGLIFLIP